MTVAVVGDGAVGLCGVLAAAQLGAERIIAMSRHESRQKLATEFGATDIVAERGDDGIAAIMDLTDGVGADAVLRVPSAPARRCCRPSARSAPAGSSGASVSRTAWNCRSSEMFFGHVGLQRRPGPGRRIPARSAGPGLEPAIDPGQVFDLELPLEQAPDAYRAMDERERSRSCSGPESPTASRPIRSDTRRGRSWSTPASELGPEGQPDRARLHELRRHRARFSAWSLDDEAAEPFFRQAVELGITFWDTANVYSYGSSEEIVGRAIKKLLPPRGHRAGDQAATSRCTTAPAARACPARRSWSRSTRRSPGSAPTTSTSTRSTASTPRRRSRRRWRRCTTSSRPARPATSAPRRCGRGSSPRCSTPPTLHGWTRFVSMQDQYSLLQREEEREMFGLLADQGVGSIPWSPLAKGRLARPWGEHDPTRVRAPTRVGKRFDGDGDRGHRRRRPADRRGARRPDGPGRAGLGAAATRWSPRRSSAPPSRTTSPTPSPRSTRLTDDEIAALEEPYGPHLPTAF